MSDEQKKEKEPAEETVERILEEEDQYYIEQGVINGVW